jgi:hypothetical protein
LKNKQVLVVPNSPFKNIIPSGKKRLPQSLFPVKVCLHPQPFRIQNQPFREVRHGLDVKNLREQPLV